MHKRRHVFKDVWGNESSKVKNAPEFVKELENFHFGEKDFHRNDSQGKFDAYKVALEVNFEYTDYVDK